MTSDFCGRMFFTLFMLYVALESFPRRNFVFWSKQRFSSSCMPNSLKDCEVVSVCLLCMRSKVVMCSGLGVVCGSLLLKRMCAP